MDVHVAVITHNFGSNIYLGVTREDVDKQVQEYVREEWQSEHGKMPEDPAAAVMDYFTYERDVAFDGEAVDTSVTTLVGDVEAALKHK